MTRGPLGRVYSRVRDWWTRDRDDDRRPTGGPPLDPAYNGLYLTDATGTDAADAAEDVRDTAQKSNEGRDPADPRRS